MEPECIPGDDFPAKDRGAGEHLLLPAEELEALREREQRAIRYVREKVNQLLALIGAFPLRPEELDDATLLTLDPIGIITDSFAQVLEHIQKTNDALKASEERYRMLVENQSDIVVKVDAKGRFLFVSPSYCEMFGRSEAELIGRKFFPLVHEDDVRTTISLMRSLSTPPHTCHHELRALTGKGWRWLAWSHKAVLDEDNRVVAVVGIGRDITERKEAEDEIQQLAYYDTLTGLPNRSLLKDRLNQTLAQASRDERQVGVMFLDLDRFKAINDRLGHAIGDKLLKKIAARLRGCMRKSDTVARLGGDEFVVVLSAIAHEEDLAVTARKILTDMSIPFLLDGHEVYTTVSIGIAIYPMDGDDADTLLKNADIAMYQAKDLGRSTCQFFSREMNSKAVERLVLENSLRRALERGEFFLHYQPQFDVRSGRIIGTEALVRWQHPDLGLFSPGNFIPLAEDTGLIIPLGEWVLRTACRQNRLWQDAGFPPHRVTVNLSSSQFKQANLIEMIAGVLAETGLDPAYLELELTERTIMKNAEEAKKTLHELKKMGVHLSIDDFGTGFSSLSYLKLFPIDRLKIAQSFVRDVTIDRDDAAIAEAIIAMARSLRLRVIAEGVERLDQLEFLRVRHCDEMQGFYLASPMSADDYAKFLQIGLDNGLYTFPWHRLKEG